MSLIEPKCYGLGTLAPCIYMSFPWWLVYFFFIVNAGLDLVREINMNGKLIKIRLQCRLFLSFKTDQGASSTLLQFMFYFGFEFVM